MTTVNIKLSIIDQEVKSIIQREMFNLKVTHQLDLDNPFLKKNADVVTILLYSLCDYHNLEGERNSVYIFSCDDSTKVTDTIKVKLDDKLWDVRGVCTKIEYMNEGRNLKIFFNYDLEIQNETQADMVRYSAYYYHNKGNSNEELVKRYKFDIEAIDSTFDIVME